MGLTSILNTATSGLNAVQTQMQWRSDNVNNSSNTNYGQRNPTTVSQGTNNVTVTMSRANDAGLTSQVLNSTADASSATVTSDAFTRLSDIMGTSLSQPNLQASVDALTASWEAFETDTSSTSSEAGVINAGVTVADTVNNTLNSIGQLIDETKSSISDSIGTLNKKLSDLSAINSKLSSDPNSSATSPELLDQRDALVKDISSVVGVTVVAHPDNSIALYTKNGAVLVDKSANQYQWNPNNGAGSYITIAGTNLPAPGLNSIVTGGKLGGALNLINPDITTLDPNVAVFAKAQAQIQEFATQLAATQVVPPVANTFEDAYELATSDRSSDATSFFLYDGTTNVLSVNATLTSGTATLKRQSATSVISQLTSSVRSIPSAGALNPTLSYAGLSATSTTYSGLATAIAAYQTDKQATAASNSTRQNSTSSTLQTRLTSEVGVNLDSEMAQMVVLQNAYSANAKVISTVQAMFDVLLNISH